jgi:hypothetical protein
MVSETESQKCQLLNRGPTPDFIPHEQFHKGLWLLPVISRSWYYYFPHSRKKVVIHNETVFLETVDEELRGLVGFLHKKGVQTTPSCAGHFYDSGYFAAHFDAIRNDAENIKNGGLLMQDVESGEYYFFKNHDYVLPWNKNEFTRYAYNYQKTGVLGIVDSERQEKLSFIHIPGMKIKTDHGTTIFLVKTENGSTQKEVWREVEEAVREVYDL